VHCSAVCKKEAKEIFCRSLLTDSSETYNVDSNAGSLAGINYFDAEKKEVAELVKYIYMYSVKLIGRR